MTKEIKQRKPRTLTPIQERIQRLSVINPDTECWEWKGSLKKNSGYPQMSGMYKRSLSGKLLPVFAHRAAYEAWMAPIPEGWTVDHTVCQNKICVNPKHLTVCTRSENSKRYWELKRKAMANA